MKRYFITAGSISITGTGILPLSHFDTIIVIFLPWIAASNISFVSDAWHSTTLSQPQASATLAREVLPPV